MVCRNKMYLRNFIFYFVPFTIIATIAAAFMHKTFILMEIQNNSILQLQIQNILNITEEQLFKSVQIAEDICIDSTLNEKNMKEYGFHTLTGMENLRRYEEQIGLDVILFLAYQDDFIVSKSGTCRKSTFINDDLKFTEESKELFLEMVNSQETFRGCVLEQHTGDKYLFFFFYYPENEYVEEKKVGFLFKERGFKKNLQNATSDLECMSLVTWEDQKLTQISGLTNDLTQDSQNEIWNSVLNGGEIKEYSTITVTANHYNMKMHVLLDNSILKSSLLREEVKMLLISSVVFVALLLAIWFYEKYRYKLLREVRQIALKRNPEIMTSGLSSDYEIIRKVLENDFAEMQKQDEMISHFRESSKNQLAWLLLNSSPPEEMDIDVLVEGYGLSLAGSYHGVLIFSMADVGEENKVVLNYPEVWTTYTLDLNKQRVIVVAISLLTRDGGREKRLELIKNIHNDFQESGYKCQGVSCGLLYEDIAELHCSYQEAQIALEEIVKSKADSKLMVMFFDELAKVIRRVPHVVSNLLEEFRETIEVRDEKKALKLLDQLVAMPKDMTEELLVYVQYKVTQILMQSLCLEGDVSEKRNVLLKSIGEVGVSFQNNAREVISEGFRQQEKSMFCEESVIAYIQQNFADPGISLVNVADYFQVSVRSISRISKRLTSKSFKEYINDLRLAKTCELLMQTDYDIKTIILQVGYYDISSFHRLFKLKFGITPNEYRKNKKRR